ncbi:MAG: hypothetical protein ACI93L_003033, partial [Cyclobacteriaceae bacterium]
NSKREFEEFGIDKSKTGREDNQHGDNIENTHGRLLGV